MRALIDNSALPSSRRSQAERMGIASDSRFTFHSIQIVLRDGLST